MNKLRTARVLMAATILLVVAFQVYWIKKLYHDESINFKKSADIIFREAMYRLQAERITGDTLIFKGESGDNLFMSDVISTIQKERIKDSGKQKMIISMSTNAQVMSPVQTPVKKYEKDTMIYVDTKGNGLPPVEVQRFLSGNHTLNDSIPVKRIDSLYAALLAKEGIDVHYRIIKSATPQVKDSATVKFTIKLEAPGKLFATKHVPVGFLNPIFYKAEFDNPAGYLLKKISVQLLLSLILITLTIASFIFIYRNLLAQKRLTELKNEFIGNITHELKTPIATVSVAIEAMKNFDALQSPERTKEYLGIAGNELNRLSLLVDKVLRLSKFETQQVELKYEWFDINTLVKEVMDSMQLQFEKTGASVKLNSEGEDFLLMADRMHITSVVYNLLDNALKYSKGKPEIEISIEAKDNQVQLSVKDNGIGIPALYKEKVFDKFFRIPHGDKHNVKGYGLGLSYVAHIIAEHKGSVNVESEEGKGTIFIIKLPKENADS